MSDAKKISFLNLAHHGLFLNHFSLAVSRFLVLSFSFCLFTAFDGRVSWVVCFVLLWLHVIGLFVQSFLLRSVRDV